MMKLIEAVFKKRSISINDYGTEVYSWVEVGKMFGYMDTLSIRKNEVAQKIVQDSTHIFISRTITDISQGDRIFVCGKGYEVNYVDNPAMMDAQLEIEVKPILDEENLREHTFYYGFHEEGQPTANEIKSLHQTVMKTKIFSKQVQGSGTVVMAYPVELGETTLMLNGTTYPDWSVSNLSINNIKYLVYTKPVTETSLTIEMY